MTAFAGDAIPRTGCVGDQSVCIINPTTAIGAIIEGNQGIPFGDKDLCDADTA